MRDDRERLRDILEAIAEIRRLVGNRSLDEFRVDADRLPAVYFYFIVIGEAASSISESIKTKYPEIPWTEISAMRNILVHLYHRLDPDIVWKTAEKDLEPLAREVQAILNDPSV